MSEYSQNAWKYYEYGRAYDNLQLAISNLQLAEYDETGAWE